MKSITLTDNDMMICRVIGNMRTMCSRANNVNDAQVGKQDAWMTDEWGVVGEYAFCKLHNIFFDCAVSPRSGSYDCMYKGARIDIKTTTLPHGQLIAVNKINPDIDVFVLAIVEGNKVSFPGFKSAKMFYRKENLKVLGSASRESYVVPQSELQEWANETETHYSKNES
jgi:hypothetical protein